MVKPITPEKLKSVYNKVSSHYDWQHSLITFNSDQKGRELVVEKTVGQGDTVIDAGAGTGTTALMAAQKAGKDGTVTLYDFSKGMLNKAKEKAREKGLSNRLIFQQGDMSKLPFGDNSFDVALSTYSLCPLFDPAQATKELYRVTKAGGKIGIAHSTDPSNSIIKWIARAVEEVYWKVPELSLGCRAVNIKPTLIKAGARILFEKKIGFPLWPFLVLVAEKPR